MTKKESTKVPHVPKGKKEMVLSRQEDVPTEGANESTLPSQTQVHLKYHLRL